MIRFKCKNCGRKLAAKSSLTGKKLKCPNCKSTILVPVDPATTIFRCTHCNQKIIAPKNAQAAGANVRSAKMCSSYLPPNKPSRRQTNHRPACKTMTWTSCSRTALRKTTHPDPRRTHNTRTSRPSMISKGSLRVSARVKLSPQNANIPGQSTYSSTP